MQMGSTLTSWITADWRVDFDAPQYLLLLALLPVFWFIGRRSLSALGPRRRGVSILLRTTLAALLIFSLAEPNWLTIINRLTVLFLVDGSDSIRPEELTHAIDYVNAAAKQRNAARGDRAGVVVFGRDATAEIPPIETPWRLSKIEAAYDPRSTNLEAALRAAEAIFPADSSKRVVIVSDGNENVGRAMPQANKLLAAGVGIDAVPISYRRRGDVAIAKLAVPSEVRPGTPFSLRIVIENRSDGSPREGRLRITRETSGVQNDVLDEPISVEPGKRVLTLTQELAQAGMATYRATFVPDDPSADSHSENNQATGFTRVSGQGHVLLIEDRALAGRYDSLVELLGENEIEVTVHDTGRPFDNLAELQQFDSVILADVARVAGEGADITQFSDAQIHDLVQNTEHFGSGLVVLGGPNSYGAGGWANTELEKAMPVDFQIESAKVEAVGALVLVIDSSGSMSGDKIAWSKAAAIAASQMLGRRDFIGVVSFDSEARWIVPLQRNGVAERTRKRISRLGAAGGTNLLPGLELAYQAILGVDASLKHVIVLTDGQTPQENVAALVTRMKQRGITTTGVAVGPDADRLLLAEIGQRGGGKFYHVLSPRAIPRIFMREARRVAMPLVFEAENGIAIQHASAGELLSGIGAIPPITGYVLTRVKEDPLVEVLLTTSRQPKPMNTILAAWQYGLGRSVALTTDIGERWAANWPNWGSYDKFLLQMIRWSMRNHDLNDRLALTTNERDGFIDVVVNAMQQDDTPSNYLSLTGTAVLPSGKSESFSMEQVAPGRYVGKLPAADAGDYYLAVTGGEGRSSLRAAVHISRTAELDRLHSSEEFLAQMAEGTPDGGEPGRLIQSPGGIADTARLAAVDVFRAGLAPAKSRQSMWPLVLMASIALFVGDIFYRRVRLDWDWLAAASQWLSMLRRESSDGAGIKQIERLKHTKANATAPYERSASTSFAEAPAGILDSRESAIPNSEAVATAARDSTTTPPGEKPEAETSRADSTEVDVAPEFTTRLLEAKRRVHERRNKPE